MHLTWINIALLAPVYGGQRAGTNLFYSFTELFPFKVAIAQV